MFAAGQALSTIGTYFLLGNFLDLRFTTTSYHTFLFTFNVSLLCMDPWDHIFNCRLQTIIFGHAINLSCSLNGSLTLTCLCHQRREFFFFFRLFSCLRKYILFLVVYYRRIEHGGFRSTRERLWTSVDLYT